MNRRLTQRGRDRRQQLMEFATARFAENGYHPTSVAEIVQGLGVGKGVFYWYFSSKEELFLEILKDAQTSLRRRQQQAIGDEADPVTRIELGIRASMAWLRRKGSMSRMRPSTMPSLTWRAVSATATSWPRRSTVAKRSSDTANWNSV